MNQPNPPRQQQTQPQQRFVEKPPAAPSFPPQRATQHVEPEALAPINPFTPAPVPVVQAPVDDSPISAHDKLWQDTKALIISAKRLNVDFEVLLRAAKQETDKGL